MGDTDQRCVRVMRMCMTCLRRAQAYLRFLTSAYLVRNADNFLPYLPDGVTMAEFIKSDV